MRARRRRHIVAAMNAPRRPADRPLLPEYAPPAASGDAEPAARAARDVAGWQRAARPLMTRMLVALTGFFFVATLAQLALLHWELLHGVAVPPPPLRADADPTFATLVHLEVAAQERHAHLMNGMLLARVWKSYVGFVTGMVLAVVGAAFVLGKLDAPETELTTSGSPVALTLRTASPGLVLATLGTLLMLVTLVTNHTIEGTSNPVYLRRPAIELPRAGGASDVAPAIDDASGALDPRDATAPPLERPPTSSDAEAPDASSSDARSSDATSLERPATTSGTGSTVERPTPGTRAPRASRTP